MTVTTLKPGILGVGSALPDPPFEFLEGGTPTGFDVELMQAIATRDGEIFILHPGDVLLAADTTGRGHRWRLIDDQPWRRVYVVLE